MSKFTIIMAIWLLVHLKDEGIITLPPWFLWLAVVDALQEIFWSWITATLGRLGADSKSRDEDGPYRAVAKPITVLSLVLSLLCLGGNDNNGDSYGTRPAIDTYADINLERSGIRRLLWYEYYETKRAQILQGFRVELEAAGADSKHGHHLQRVIDKLEDAHFPWEAVGSPAGLI